MKKAQGLTLNTMVIAVIALVVVIVTIALFSGVINNKAVPFFQGQTSCTTQAKPGECTTQDQCEGAAVFGVGCEEPTPYCCVVS